MSLCVVSWANWLWLIGMAFWMNDNFGQGIFIFPTVVIVNEWGVALDAFGTYHFRENPQRTYLCERLEFCLQSFCSETKEKKRILFKTIERQKTVYATQTRETAKNPTEFRQTVWFINGSTRKKHLTPNVDQALSPEHAAYGLGDIHTISHSTHSQLKDDERRRPKNQRKKNLNFDEVEKQNAKKKLRPQPSQSLQTWNITSSTAVWFVQKRAKSRSKARDDKTLRFIKM